MIEDTYERAYVEVLEILKHLPEEDYNKIPKEKIEYYEKNQDPNYAYQFNEYLPIEQQRISRKAKAIIITLFRDYFSNEVQQQKLNVILQENSKKVEKAKSEKYNSDNIFGSNKVSNEESIAQEKVESKNMAMTEKTSWYKKVMNFIKSIFKI